MLFSSLRMGTSLDVVKISVYKKPAWSSLKQTSAQNVSRTTDNCTYYALVLVLSPHKSPPDLQHDTCITRYFSIGHSLARRNLMYSPRTNTQGYSVYYLCEVQPFLRLGKDLQTLHYKNFLKPLDDECVISDSAPIHGKSDGWART